MRGEPVSREIIGHNVVGEYKNVKFTWGTKALTKAEAEKFVSELGIKPAKCYPIYKEEPKIKKETGPGSSKEPMTV